LKRVFWRRAQFALPQSVRDLSGEKPRTARLVRESCFAPGQNSIRVVNRM
jgi:hypothetical protein